MASDLTLAEVERQAVNLMRQCAGRNGLTVERWLKQQLQDAAKGPHPPEAADEITALRATIAELEAKINLKADFIDATINDQAKAHQEHIEMRATIAKLEADNDRLEICVGWLADVSAATAYDFASKRSTGKGERSRQISIMEKTIAMLDGAAAPSRSAQDGVKARCQRTIAELGKPLLSNREPQSC